MGITCAPTFRCYSLLQALGDRLKISFVIVDLHAVSVASQARKNGGIAGLKRYGLFEEVVYAEWL